jgi:NAD(P)-dependent dehydrogenase (short-subunit alcohol dehydrogenase family)
MPGICDGRVVIVTGAGRGIGRGHALEFARQGAKVVVNDVGAALDGNDPSTAPAREVVAEIEALGGEAVASTHDVSDWDAAKALIATAVDTFGRLDTVVNNAGIVRDRMLVSIEPSEIDAVLAVHLRGTLAMIHHGANHWRERAKAGEENAARIVNTSSGAGLFGSVGQTAYSAAKAGIATATLIAAVELARYGITVNAIAPSARTRMTEVVFADTMAAPESGFDAMHPDNVAPLVVWLGSAGSTGVTGQVFEVEGGKLCVAEGWQRGPEIDRGERWDPADIGPAVAELLAKARPSVPVYGA